MTRQEQEPRITAIVALLRGMDIEIPAERLAEIISTIAPVPLTQRRLELALLKHPGILEGRHSNVPVTVQDLAHALVSEGVTQVVLPTCESCGRSIRLPHKTAQGGRHCSRCERNARAVACATCNQVKPVHCTVDSQQYCRRCWRNDPRSFGLCSQCRKQASIIVRRPQLVCFTCYSAPAKTCGLCGKLGRTATHIDGRRICARCYYAMRTPQSCPECGIKVFLTGIKNDQRVCAVCADSPVTMACPGCGSVTADRKHHLCVDCRRPLEVERLLGDEAGIIRPELQPLGSYLLTHHRNAISLSKWRYRNRCGGILRELADGSLPLTPTAIIDRAPNGQTAAFLLSLLARSGTLSALDVEAARLGLMHV